MSTPAARWHWLGRTPPPARGPPRSGPGRNRSHGAGGSSPTAPNRRRPARASPRPTGSPSAPQVGRAHPHQSGDRRGKRDRVVLVEDPRHQREGQRGDDEPRTPDEVCRPRQVGAGRSSAQRHTDKKEDERGGKQPRGLTTQGPPRRAEPARRAPAATTADRAGLLAVEPAQAVVAEGQLEDGVGLGTADVRAVRGGDELDDGDPPARPRTMPATPAPRWPRRARRVAGRR